MAAPESPGAAVRDPGPPWREAAVAAGLVLFGWPIALLAFAFPLTCFLAVADGRRRRFAVGVLGAAISLVLLVQLPWSRFFFVAAALSVGVTLFALRSYRRVGYPELSLCVAAGLAAAAALWLLAEPGFFPWLRSEIRTFMLREGRLWMDMAAQVAPADARSRLVMEQLVAASAEWSARGWPAGAFSALWLGSGPALALAARWAAGGGKPAALCAKVRVTERCAVFRLPEPWVWLFLLGVVAFLAAPHGSPASEGALNVALVAAGLYAWQGVTIVLYYLERRRVRPFARVLILAAGFLLLTLPLFVLAVFLGLADARLNLRFRKAGGPPAASES